MSACGLQVTAEYLTHIEALTERLSNIAVDTASQDVLGDEQIAILQAQQEYVRFWLVLVWLLGGFLAKVYH